jgi:hypothetical protein
MQTIQFLDRLESICLEEFEKENQILSQKENKRRSSQMNAKPLPFTERIMMRKATKKITFKLDPEQ